MPPFLSCYHPTVVVICVQVLQKPHSFLVLTVVLSSSIREWIVCHLSEQQTYWFRYHLSVTKMLIPVDCYQSVSLHIDNYAILIIFPLCFRVYSLCSDLWQLWRRRWKSVTLISTNRRTVSPSPCTASTVSVIHFIIRSFKVFSIDDLRRLTTHSGM